MSGTGGPFGREQELSFWLGSICHVYKTFPWRHLSGRRTETGPVSAFLLGSSQKPEESGSLDGQESHVLLVP